MLLCASLCRYTNQFLVAWPRVLQELSFVSNCKSEVVVVLMGETRIFTMVIRNSSNFFRLWGIWINFWDQKTGLLNKGCMYMETKQNIFKKSFLTSLSVGTAKYFTLFFRLKEFQLPCSPCQHDVIFKRNTSLVSKNWKAV